MMAKMSKVLKALQLSIFSIFAKVSMLTEDAHRRCSSCSSSRNYLLLLREREERDAKVLTSRGAYARAYVDHVSPDRLAGATGG